MHAFSLEFIVVFFFSWFEEYPNCDVCVYVKFIDCWVDIKKKKIAGILYINVTVVLFILGLQKALCANLEWLLKSHFTLWLYYTYLDTTPEKFISYLHIRIKHLFRKTLSHRINSKIENGNTKNKKGIVQLHIAQLHLLLSFN